MATTVEGAIEQVLLARLGTLVLSPAHPVAWPNNNFTKPADNRYLEAKFVPNAANRVFIDSDGPHERIGFLQVNVRDGLNKGPRITDIAGAVAAHFPTDLKLPHAIGLTVRISSAADVGSMLVETTSPGVLVPVLIPWSCWA
jgi:hypothetical protein